MRILIKLLRDSSILAVVPRIGMMMKLFALPFITPFLTSMDFGIYGTIVSISGILGGLSSLGLHALLVNHYYERSRNFNIVWGEILRYMLFGSSLIAVLFSVLLLLLPISVSYQFKLWLILLVSINLIGQPFVLMGDLLFTIKREIKRIFILHLTSNILSTSLMCVAMIYYKLGFLGWFVALAVNGSIVGLYYLYVFLNKYSIKMSLMRSLKNLKFYLAESWPIIPHNMSHRILSSGDRVVMSSLNISASSIGYYTQATIFMGLFNSVIDGFFGSVINELQIRLRRFEKDDLVDIRKFILFIFILLALCASIVTLNSELLYKLAFRNPELWGYSNFLGLLILGLVSKPFYVIYSALFIIEKRTKYLLWLSLFPAILNIVLNIPLIFYFGYEVALYTTIVSYFLMSTMGFFMNSTEKIKNIFSLKYLVGVILPVNLILLLVAHVEAYLSIHSRITVSIGFILISALFILKRKGDVLRFLTFNS